jgi:ribosome assembly protein 4
VISKSIQEDVLRHPTADITPEDVITVYCTPQSVFRVRPATRCSSTLSGKRPLSIFLPHA